MEASLKAIGHNLGKSEFQDALKLRLGITPHDFPNRCVCSKPFTIIDTTAAIGGYVNLRHYRKRDFIHKKASLIYKETQIEPKLRPVEDQSLPTGTNLAKEAREDAGTNGLHRDFRNTYRDIKVTNLMAETHSTKPPKEVFKTAEEYKERDTSIALKRWTMVHSSQ